MPQSGQHRREIEAEIETWRLELRLPSEDVGLYLEINGKFSDGSTFGNLCLCQRSPENIRYMIGLNPPDEIPLGYIPELGNDGIIFATNPQILGFLEQLKTGTKIHMLLTIEDREDGSFFIHSLQTLSHSNR